MATIWYLTLYNMVGGKYILDSYTKHNSYDSAKYDQLTLRPYAHQEYVVENVVGSRSGMPHYVIKPRAKYSASNTKKCRDEKMAEHQAQKLLVTMRQLSPNATIDTIRSITLEALVLKQHLTDKQYNTLIAQLQVLPCCVNLMHQYDLENISSKYI